MKNSTDFKNKFPDLGDELRRAVEEVASRHGLRTTCGEPRRGQDGTFRITFAFSEPPPEGRDEAEREWNHRAERLGFRREWLGRSFEYGRPPLRYRYTVTGLRVEPFVRVLLRREDGETCHDRPETFLKQAEAEGWTKEVLG